MVLGDSWGRLFEILLLYRAITGGNGAQGWQVEGAGLRIQPVKGFIQGEKEFVVVTGGSGFVPEFHIKGEARGGLGFVDTQATFRKPAIDRAVMNCVGDMTAETIQPVQTGRESEPGR